MSEMTLAQAVNECGKWGNLVRALSKVTEAANHIASLVQQEAELKQKLEHVRVEVTAAEQARDRATAEAIELRAQAQRATEDAKSGAKDAAASLVHAAKEEVAELQGLAAAAKASAAEAVQLRDSAIAETNAAKAELEQLLGKLEEARAIEQAVAQARKRFEG